MEQGGGAGDEKFVAMASYTNACIKIGQILEMICAKMEYCIFIMLRFVNPKKKKKFVPFSLSM